MPKHVMITNNVDDATVSPYKFTSASAHFGSAIDYIDVDTLGVVRMIGSAGIVIPHLMQSDSSTQAIADVNSAQVVTFSTDIHHNGITRTSSSRFTITKQGSYLIAVSGIADSTSAGKHLEIWLRVNGIDVDESNTRLQLPGNSETIFSVTFIYHFNIGDYFEFWTWGDDTGCKWLATGTGGSPTRPAIPSIIITCNYIGYD